MTDANEFIKHQPYLSTELKQTDILQQTTNDREEDSSGAAAVVGLVLTEVGCRDNSENKRRGHGDDT